MLKKPLIQSRLPAYSVVMLCETVCVERKFERYCHPSSMFFMVSMFPKQNTFQTHEAAAKSSIGH